MGEQETAGAELEVIGAIDEYLERFLPALSALPNKLRELPEAAKPDIYDASEGLLWLTRAITLTGHITGVEPEFEPVSDTIKAIFYGLENADYEYVADAVEYDAIPIVKRWKTGMDARNAG